MGGAGPEALRGGPGFGSRGPGSCAREAGGGLGVLLSTMGLRCPGAHRVPVSPVPKAVLGDGRPAVPQLCLSTTTVVPVRVLEFHGVVPSPPPPISETRSFGRSVLNTVSEAMEVQNSVFGT